MTNASSPAPPLPALSAEFGGLMGQGRLTLSGLILSFGLSQLAMGPWSDRDGRKPVLLGGLYTFLVAVAFRIGLGLGRVLGRTVLPMTLTLGFMGVMTALMARAVMQRHGELSRGEGAAGGGARSGA